MHPPEIAIRPLRRDHHSAWLSLWRSYLTFYEAELAAEMVQLTFERLIDPAEPMDGALAWRGADAVGLVHRIRHRSCWTAGDYCYLQDLFVAPAARGAGVGSALIEHVYEAARREGCSRVHWLTHESNAAAQRVYDRLAERSGFIQYRKLF
jgi:GNAT superfamily N-acetyltransferase